MDGAEARDLYPAIVGDAREAPMSKGSRQNGSITSGKGLALRVGLRSLHLDPASWRWSARAARVARADCRVPVRRRAQNVPGGPQNPHGALPWAVNGRLRTGTDKGNPIV
ncbi:hypothetical protein R1flu_027780 [Riccia fluitans]|uniref:Uncharacterized protein n=1 Tax=Riccia fluitans TaxID=41844 RepID=A0ABD1XJT5_9MARC